MEQPRGILRAKFTYVYKLKKAQNGLKQEPRAWYGKIKVVLQCDYPMA